MLDPPRACYACDSTRVVRTVLPDTVHYRDHLLTLPSIVVWMCQECGDASVDADAMDARDAAVRAWRETHERALDD